MRNLLPLIVALCCSAPAFCQFQNIMISNADSPQEPCITINPKNVAEIVAGSNLNNVYISTDTGNTWQEQKLSSSYGVWGDPFIITDTAGRFYFFHLSAPTGTHFAPDWLDRIVCQRLDNINGTWNNGSYTGLNGLKDQDKEWGIVDRKTNTIYISWTQFDKYASPLSQDSSTILFAKSTDLGNSWSAPMRINDVAGDCIDKDNTVEGATPCVGPNGEVYVSWVGPAGIVFDRSLDGGQTWLPLDKFVSDIPGGWDLDIPGIDRSNGLPFIACDISGGSYNGTIYINWADQRNGANNTDIWLSKSTDGGNTWSAPAKVNTDNNITAHQFLTSMAIDQKTGYLYFLFYDRRNHSGNQTDVYMAYSTDGGVTFHDKKISTTPFTPFSTVFFGDYTSISAHDNVIRPIWGRTDGTQQSIWTAKVDVPKLFGWPADVQDVKVELDNSYPNPFYETTFISFKLREKAVVQLDVMDLYGRRINTIAANDTLAPGRHAYKFDSRPLSLAPGVYFFHLRCGNEVRTRKIILAE